MSSTTSCPGLSSNPDISGPGVRIALYLQSLLSVILVRLSPDDAPGAYWSMTSTALSLIVSSIVTSLTKSISLLDAIVVVYVLLLPILASAFGLSEIISSTAHKSAVRRIHSPLLIIANWTRSALTYSFALYVWTTAPTFGSDTECNQSTKFIFFGANLPATTSGRILNLVGWSLLTLLFVWRTIKGGGTLLVAFMALFSSSASDSLLKPKRPPENEVHLETVDTVNYRTGVRTHSERAYRPLQIFHEVLQGVMNQILGWAPSGKGTWYKAYGQLLLTGLLAAWAIIMTELELVKNDTLDDGNSQWGFGQVLPMVLTISPLFALFESLLARRSSGPNNHSRKLRFTLHSAAGLQRPSTELENMPPEVIALLEEDTKEKIRAPNPFAVVTIDERDMYVTYDQQDKTAPDWEESFDVRMTNLSTMVVRVYDLKCMDRGQPALIGFTTLLPFSLLPPPVGETSADPVAERTEKHTVLLIYNGKTIPSMTISISFSTDVKGPLPPPKLPPRFLGQKQLRREIKTGIISFRGKRIGSNKVTTTETYWLA